MYSGIHVSCLIGTFSLSSAPKRFSGKLNSFKLEDLLGMMKGQKSGLRDFPGGAAQWIRRRAPKAGGPGSIPGLGN